MLGLKLKRQTLLRRYLEPVEERMGVGFSVAFKWDTWMNLGRFESIFVVEVVCNLQYVYAALF